MFTKHTMYGGNTMFIYGLLCYNITCFLVYSRLLFQQLCVQIHSHEAVEETTDRVVTLCCSSIIIKLCGFRRKQPVLARNLPPLSHTAQAPFSLQQQSLRHLMTFLPKLGFIFCLSMMITLIWPQTSSLWKGFPHSPLPMRGNCYFGFVSQLYKDTCYCPVWALYTNTIHQQVWEEFFSLQRDVMFVECVG